MSEIADARIELFTPEQGGRKTPLQDPASGQYRPHLVIEGSDEMLGVIFQAGPDTIEPGVPAEVSMNLIYYPEVSYEALQPGTRFTICEGPKSVGKGAIIRRWREALRNV